MTNSSTSEMKKELKKTSQELHKFLKQRDFSSFEKKIVDYWSENDTFAKLREKNRSGERFSFYDGPITANNPMGVHHAWGRTLKDVFQRYQAMQGKQQRYQNGFDCQGLWLEVEVEKALGLNSKKEIIDYGLEKFAQACKKRVNHFAAVITQQSIRLGQWMDWSNSYYTYDDNNIEHIWHFLKKCHENGWLYLGTRVLPWCYRCGTSLSSHEQSDSYEELTHKAVYIKLPFKDETQTYFLVWTTTPWTLTANVALAVNPELDYLIIQKEQEKFVLAKGTQDVLERPWDILEVIKGKELLEKMYIGPFDDLTAQKDVKLKKVIPWDEVSHLEGTGVVHIAPGCGEEDYELSKRYKLDVIAPIDGEARYIEGFDYLTGITISKAFDLIIEKLKSKGFLYKTELYEHRYPVCWRCKTELVFKLEKEWFINCDEIRPKLLKAVKEIKWKPDFTAKSMESWLTSMDDWCISRKRYWGLPLPFYVCDCGHVTVVGSKEELKSLSVNPQNVDDLTELHIPWIDEVKVKCYKCGKSVSRVKEVGDCWLDAGIIPFSTLNYLKEEEKTYWKKWFPAELIVEMKEQVRLWFYSMLFMSITLINKPSYKNVVSFPEVRNEEGKRLSKTSKNNIVFDDAVNVLGADVMRWVYCKSNLRQNLNFSYDLGKDAMRKLLSYWNVAYFLLSSASAENFSLSELKELRETNKTNPMDRWMLSELNKTVEEIRNAYENLNVKAVIDETEEFFENISNWYVRLNRRRFWKSDLDLDKKQAYNTLYRCLDTFNKCLAPILPFTTEYVYRMLTPLEDFEKVPSVHLCSFPENKLSKEEDRARGTFNKVKQLISMVLMLRNNSQIKVRQPLNAVQVWSSNPSDYNAFKEYKTQILTELNIKKLDILTGITESVEFVIKLNYSLLGPKYKKRLNEIKKKVVETDQQTLSGLFRKKRVLALKTEPNEITLQPDEYEILLQDKEGHKSLVQDDLSVTLDVTLTNKLRVEGCVRDIVRNIQKMRQELDLEITETIIVAIIDKTPESSLLSKIKDFRNYLKSETLAREIVFNEELHDTLLSTSFNFDENTLTVQISKK